jgi:DNA-binding NarL/FixJ family response regulator
MKSPRRSRVILADDHPIMLAGVHGLLNAAGTYAVVATASNGAGAMERIRELRPDLAILDINMPELTGLEVLQIVEREEITTRVVLLTASVQDDQIATAVATGAWGIVLKDAAGDQLVGCLDHVASGRRWLPEEVIGPALERASARQSENAKYNDLLTAREREIAILVARGLSNKHISRQTGITEGTVKIHLHNIYQKLNVINRTTLAAVVQEHSDKT